MRKYIFLFLFTFLFGQSDIPNQFTLRTAQNDSSTQEGLTSNVVAEIKFQGDSLVWLGTGRGLALFDGHSMYTYQTATDTLSNGATTFTIPSGGISAISVTGDSLFAAIATDDGTIQMGGGLVFSSNAQDTNGIQWEYLSQPVDQQADTLVPFGQGYFYQLPVTVPQANVTYDASFHSNNGNDYVWITSWAGGLRRYDLTNKVWANVPLPQDNQVYLSTCESDSFDVVDGKSILRNYYLNPRDPIDGGNHNHKAFSVLAYGDTVWAGTANGINRGIIVDEVVDNVSYRCVNWDHYSYPEDGLSGNFVVSIAKQYWNGMVTVWASTVNAEDPGEQRGLSYTRDGGETWNAVLLGERVYNVTAQDSLILASTSSGLWKSLDGENWARFSPAIDKTYLSMEQILSNTVYTSALDIRDSTMLWIGTPDGVAYTGDLHGESWVIHRAEYDSSEVYAFPNPFSPYNHNQLDNDGYVRFHLGAVVNNTIEVTVYNFAMEKVYSYSYDRRTDIGAIKWNGRDEAGSVVSNGVYFINLNYASQNSSPENHWTKLILVK